MKRFFVFLISMVPTLFLTAQNISISFVPKETAQPVDSAIVTNQNTGQKVKLTGNELLSLNNPTGVSFIPSNSNVVYLYPNPNSGEATLFFSTEIEQEAKIYLSDVTGRLASSVRLLLVPGQHRFKVVFPSRGLFTVSVLLNDAIFAVKATCLLTSVRPGILIYEGRETVNQFKSASLGKTLKYSTGDVLLYSAYSGKSNTLMTDSPTAEKIYSVEFPEAIDPENKTYKVVKIGNQWWFAENLQTSKYKDGTDIPYVTTAADWSVLSQGAFAWYNNDEAANRNLYGGYYNWVAVNSGKLCPSGWHVPNDAEWKTLEIALGMTQSQADINGLRNTGTGTLMKAGTGLDTGGRVYNSSGFSGNLGGYRLSDGTFNYAAVAAYWWCATEASAAKSWFRSLYKDNSSVSRSDIYKVCGVNIRCVRD